MGQVNFAVSKTGFKKVRVEFQRKNERHAKKWVRKAAYEWAFAGNALARAAEAHTVDA